MCVCVYVQMYMLKKILCVCAFDCFVFTFIAKCISFKITFISFIVSFPMLCYYFYLNVCTIYIYNLQSKRNKFKRRYKVTEFDNNKWQKFLTQNNENVLILITKTNETNINFTYKNQQNLEIDEIFSFLNYNYYIWRCRRHHSLFLPRVATIHTSWLFHSFPLPQVQIYIFTL